MTAIGPPPSNQRGGSCPRRLTETRRLCDGCVNHKTVTDRLLARTRKRGARQPVTRESSTRLIWGRMSMPVLAACAFGAIAAVLHMRSIATVIPRIRRSDIKPTEAERAEGISIVRPVCGLENFSEETLSSAFRLDYPNYEILFCVAQPADPVLPLVRHLIELNPHVPA